MPESIFLNTPLLHHRHRGKHFYLKMDCWQPSGSFKLRGMTHLARHYQAQGKTELVSSSGGNAGYSAAWAARELGMRITVITPDTTPPQVRHKIEALGAEVQVKGSVWDEADQYARQLVEEKGAAYVPPFEHPALWAGHSSLVDEIAAEYGHSSPPFEAGVVAVGGGGLLCGVLEGFARHGWGHIPMLAAETEGAASYAAALAAGRPIQIPEIRSVAKSLGALKVSETAFNWSKRHPIHSMTVSDEQALNACKEFTSDFRTLVEPACGAALCAMYEDSPLLAAYDHILIVVCGGIGVDLRI
jgi:L-serine/L-threonine ammonia-lyase